MMSLLACAAAVDSAALADEISIPGGSFSMGAGDEDADESPAHAVELSAFRLDRWEVTVGDYRACTAEGACAAVATEANDDLPMTGVAYEEAEAFCGWRGRALPTEAQWEYAARGEDGRRYPWGDEEPDCTLAGQRTCTGAVDPVGSHPEGASPFGVEDLAGNAWEIVADWYDADYYAVSPKIDPAGGESGGLRTLRGVELWSDPAVLRASNREYAIPTARSVLVGFRCAGLP